MTDSTDSVSRRRVLATIGGGSLTALAGCSAKKPKNVDKSRYQKPEIATTDRWKLQQEILAPRKIATLGAYTSGEIYTDTQLSNSLDIVPGEINQPLAAFFAAQVNIFTAGWGGNLLYGFVGSQKILNKAGPTIRQKLRNQFNLRNISGVSSNGEKPKRAEAHKELSGEFPLKRIKEVTLENGKTETVALSGTFPVRIFSSCWQVADSEDYLLVGGAYPESDHTKLVGSLTSGRGVGIDVTVRIDLGFEPEEIRSRILHRIGEVSPRT